MIYHSYLTERSRKSPEAETAELLIFLHACAAVLTQTHRTVPTSFLTQLSFKLLPTTALVLPGPIKARGIILALMSKTVVRVYVTLFTFVTMEATAFVPAVHGFNTGGVARTRR